MNFNLNQNKPVIALLGAGCMGTAIVRRIAAGKIILLGDISEKNLDKTATELRYGGYEVYTQIVDATDRASVQAFAKKAASLGLVKYFIDTAGASPNQASPEHIVKLDLVSTAIANCVLFALLIVLNIFSRPAAFVSSFDTILFTPKLTNNLFCSLYEYNNSLREFCQYFLFLKITFY